MVGMRWLAACCLTCALVLSACDVDTLKGVEAAPLERPPFRLEVTPRRLAHEEEPFATFTNEGPYSLAITGVWAERETRDGWEEIYSGCPEANQLRIEKPGGRQTLTLHLCKHLNGSGTRYLRSGFYRLVVSVEFETSPSLQTEAYDQFRVVHH